jgi:hypothetical protein
LTAEEAGVGLLDGPGRREAAGLRHWQCGDGPASSREWGLGSGRAVTAWRHGRSDPRLGRLCGPSTTVPEPRRALAPSRRKQCRFGRCRHRSERHTGCTLPSLINTAYVRGRGVRPLRRPRHLLMRFHCSPAWRAQKAAAARFALSLTRVPPWPSIISPGRWILRPWGIMREALKTANRSRRTTTVDALMYPPLGVGKRACSTATLKSRSSRYPDRARAAPRCCRAEFPGFCLLLARNRKAR